MPTDAKPVQRLISLFAEQPCWMITPLASELRYSIPSVRRFLVEAGYFNSFTHNGGWYTLRSTPQFDPDGLWFYRDIGFSRAGSLTNTLTALVTNSPAGMTAEELGGKLRCRCHSILVHLCRQAGLQRQKQGRSHRYLAADTHTADLQCQAMTGLSGEQLPAEIAVFVLAEFIHNPHFSFEQLAAALAHSKGVIVEVRQLERLFAQHGLKKRCELRRHGLIRPGAILPGDTARTSEKNGQRIHVPHIRRCLLPVFRHHRKLTFCSKRNMHVVPMECLGPAREGRDTEVEP